MPPTDASKPVLEARKVSKRFTLHGPGQYGKEVHALEPVTLALHPGRITALVGESGSGKSTLARLLALAHPPTSGEIRLDGERIAAARTARGKRAYYRQVQMVFQDPFSSLSPVHRVRHILGRPLQLHGGAQDKAARERQTVELLERVNLTPADQFIDKFPHELSGGQRQRVAIARALAARPRVLLGDEPVSMLDVSIRLDILNLLGSLRDDGLAILYITHDIAGARYFADEIKVLYAGQLVESGPGEELVRDPRHPYTRLLVESAPDPDRIAPPPDPDGDDAPPGEPPSLVDPPGGCRFHPRCPLAVPQCATTFPPRTHLSAKRWVHCWSHDAGVPQIPQADPVPHTDCPVPHTDRPVPHKDKDNSP
ncbi:dipeptide/oligopeptide/nickel ABC transporter ATP-binding protein [Streptomyces spiroverticillatus]|uniref:Dipeptide/oligopeptide/nickel ABC transporter ATP-binding protein n=1 Tax=Streptomyces finlayi TaxID=67296 RepID=A0A918WYT7_9ACTN|nr:ABC transporter ATP-binding protein [Streptomyces finlayi]GHA15324.1 dipeptide/oligopeptide/nickel ABC transporter ATP-binding protein [Streptomyces spiroverticillatus]GHC96768.1 dipeptide/oligopeptide/nickel ABC transporter ATP-binding protein [Streptomyces finlayi]